VEEANEISETDQKDLDLRMRGINRLGYQMTMTFNPISELHWLKRKYFDVPQPNVFVLKTTYKDNKYLDEAYRTRLEELINEDYQYYRIYALGEWGSLGNLIFTNWQVCDMTQMVDLGDRKVPMKSTFDNYYNGLDFGYSSDPLAFERVHLDPKNKVIYVTDELYQRELQNDETAKILKPLVQRETVTCDSAERYRNLPQILLYGDVQPILCDGGTNGIHPPTPPSSDRLEPRSPKNNCPRVQEKVR
jgi:phage terminase large subunit